MELDIIIFMSTLRLRMVKLLNGSDPVDILDHFGTLQHVQSPATANLNPSNKCKFNPDNFENGVANALDNIFSLASGISGSFMDRNLGIGLPNSVGIEILLLS